MRKILLLGFTLMLAACSSLPERKPLPTELSSEAGIYGVPEARFWADEWPEYSRQRLNGFSDEEIKQHYPAIYGVQHNYLAISGGGAQGAFGAGLLKGWSESGTRPEFTMVTGISTGALAAPFAFLGPAYDDELETVYTTTTTDKIARERNLLNAAFSDAVTDTQPLAELIAKYITPEIINEIGKKYRRGRRLYIGTFNLDAGRSVIWNIGGIAISDYPDKVELIHSVLRASAAIPVAFPPVMIPVHHGEEVYDEMHVDGGTGSQVFVYPSSINWQEITEKLHVKGQPKVYVIRNASLDPDYEGTERKIVPIASRSISSLIKTQGIGDMYQIHDLCQRDGNEFNLAYIPADFDLDEPLGFDPAYMTALFNFGYELAKNGYPWERAPPGFDVSL